MAVVEGVLVFMSQVQTVTGTVSVIVSMTFCTALRGDR